MNDLEILKDWKKKYDEQKYYVAQLRSMNGLSAVTYDKDPVQVSPSSDQMVNLMIKIEQAEIDLERYRRVYIGWWACVLDKIHKMPVDDLQRLMYLVHIEDLTLTQASMKMFWSYDYTRKQYKKALAVYENVR